MITFRTTAVAVTAIELHNWPSDGLHIEARGTRCLVRVTPTVANRLLEIAKHRGWGPSDDTGPDRRLIRGLHRQLERAYRLQTVRTELGLHDEDMIKAAQAAVNAGSEYWDRLRDLEHALGHDIESVDLDDAILASNGVLSREDAMTLLDDLHQKD